MFEEICIDGNRISAASAFYNKREYTSNHVFMKISRRKKEVMIFPPLALFINKHIQTNSYDIKKCIFDERGNSNSPQALCIKQSIPNVRFVMKKSYAL